MANRYWVGGTGTWNTTNTANWSATSGGASGASVPTSADFVTINASSGGGVITFGNDVDCQGIDIRFYTGTIDFSTYVMNCSGNGFIIFRQDGTSTLAGTKVVNSNYAGATGTRTFTMLSVTEANSPTINVTAGTDTVSSSGNTRYNNLNFTGFAGTWNNIAITLFGSLTVSTGMTVNAGANALTFSATSGTKTITTNGKTLDFPLIFNGVGGTFAFQDALTQGSTRAFTITNGTVQLKDGVTSTVGSFVATSANVKFLQSTTPGTQATLSQASGTVTASNLTIKDNNATGGATWNAYVDQSNIDAGNNDGWNFGISPVVGGAEYTYTIRSFTQPRRF